MSRNIKGRQVTRELNGVIVTDLLPSKKIQSRTVVQVPKTSKGLACIICMENIREIEKIWVCELCRIPIHLDCVKRWYESNMGRSTPGAWHCPSCRHPTTDPPTGSYCFCGKTTSLNGIRINQRPLHHCCLHLCNHLCSVSRGDLCQHRCKSLCHKGLCPPCDEPNTFSCWCGKTIKQAKCSEIKKLDFAEISCGEVCGRVLNCEKHYCEKKCHQNNCDPCIKVNYKTSCYCGRNEYTFYCGQGTYPYEKTCGGVCNKVLSCGIHLCKSFCHRDDCAPCPLDPAILKTCACGKTSIEDLGVVRTSCDQPLLTCNKICGLELPCRDVLTDHNSATHTCKKPCHVPPCEPCTQSTYAYCRCGNTQMFVPCRNVYYPNPGMTTCLRFCSTMLSCRKHRCKNICCPKTEMHQCNLRCQEMGECGKHPCTRLCHSDFRHRCGYVYESTVYCKCGLTCVPPPSRCSRTFPECPSICPVKCPSGHCDAHPCHRMDTECPPCTYLTKKMCVNNHKMVAGQRCSNQNVFCTTVCEKPLKCGHTCRHMCHSGTCQERLNGPCTQGCRTIRPECSHPCNAECHFPRPCHSSPCLSKVHIMCQCKLRVQIVTCDDYTWFISRIKETNCNFELKFENSERICLPCNYDCKIKARLCQLAEAFKIEKPSHSELITPCGSPDLNREQLDDILKREFS